MRNYYENKFETLKTGENNALILQHPENELVIMGFSGRAKKNKFYFKFPNKEKRDIYIEKFLKEQENLIKRKHMKREEEKKIINESIEIGKIYYTSWGYEQTNGEFYQVVGRKGKKTLLLKEIGSNQISSGFDSGYFEAVKDNFISENIIETRVGSMKIGKDYKKYLYEYKNKAVYRSWYY